MAVEMMSAPAWAKEVWATERGEGLVRSGVEDQRYLSRSGGGSWAWRVVPRPPSRMRIGGLEGPRSRSDIFMVFTVFEIRSKSSD